MNKKSLSNLQNIFNYIRTEDKILDYDEFIRWIFDYNLYNDLFKNWKLIKHYIEYHNSLYKQFFERHIPFYEKGFEIIISFNYSTNFNTIKPFFYFC